MSLQLFNQLVLSFDVFSYLIQKLFKSKSNFFFQQCHMYSSENIVNVLFKMVGTQISMG
jgi:hypothetical protein